MRVLISAYACAPDEGSEPGVGWAWSTAAATIADVVLLTRSNNVGTIEAAVASDERNLSLTVVGVEGPAWLRRLKKRMPFGVQLYYAAWQRSARRQALKLHAERPFDVTHHLTFAADWLPATAVQLAGVPFVWGPVAGATYLPRGASEWLSGLELTVERLRAAATRLTRRVYGRRNARAAALSIFGSSDTAGVLEGFARASVLEPNVVAEPANNEARTIEGQSTVAWVGRLVGWKGPRLAAEVARRLPAGCQVHVFGAGAVSAEIASASNVQLRGHLPRAELLRELAKAHVLLATSLHESVGWAVGEAQASGVAVVAVEHGGHIDVVRRGGGTLVPFGKDIAPRLANEISRALALPRAEPSGTWSADRLAPFLSEVYSGFLS